MNCSTIPLTQGQVALVDAQDYEVLRKHRWYAYWNPSTRSFYAARHLPRLNGKYRVTYMHRQILGLEIGDPRTGDHIRAGQTLDNRRENLRIATPFQQQCNKRMRSDNTSGHRGVRWDGYKWSSRIQFSSRTIHLGRTDSLEEAIALRKEGEIKYHGEYAYSWAETAKARGEIV